MLSLDFGFSAVVKRFEQGNPHAIYIDPNDPEQKEKPVWDEGNVDALLWKPFVALPPEQVEPRFSSSGEFNGIRYDTKQDVPLAFPSNKIFDRDDAVDVPLVSSLWVTNEKDSVFGSPWGYPRLGYAFRYWWSYWYRWALADRHFEKDADPPALVRYPDKADEDILDEDDETVNYKEIALGIGEQMRSGSTIAMPSTPYTSEIDGKTTGIYEWDMKFIEGGGNFDAFDKTFDRLEVLKLRSIWVPEQAFLEGQGGTSSRNVAKTMTDSFQEAQAVLMDEFDYHLNHYIIPQLVQVNFPEFKGDARKITTGFGSEDTELAKQLVQLIGQSDPNALEVDVREILERAGIPVLSQTELERKKKQAIEEAQALAPPATAPVAGQSAGVISTPQTDTGFSYIQPREIIYLTDDAFAAGLPDSQHYRDREILARTTENRELWRAGFEAAYEDFASFIANASLNFADEEEEAENIIKRWGHSFSNLSKKTIDVVKNIMQRAGNAELKKANITTDTWDFSGTPADWAERHGLTLVKGVEETVRKELRSFLADEIRAGHSNEEIANNVRLHFADFPSWKADRLARTETMLAYNYATLFAGRAAGVKKVQAIDAQKGPTDEDCEVRNGQIFDIDSAFGENLREHPNGTLAWRLLRRENLSVEYVDRSETGDRLAWFEPDTDTIYLAKDIEPSQEEFYLLTIGEQINDES
jgi:SPP1 gp7 family putative phage head morphogenesis protein